jgi:glycosyltransferase involved in cell wall biosynthesis
MKDSERRSHAKPTVSVIIPAYNENRTIGSVAEVARTWPRAMEVIVVNDASTDSTEESLKRLGSTITVITLKKNMGKGNALAEGISQSRGSIVIFLDGDIIGLTHADLDAIVNPVLLNQADMVIGCLDFLKLGSFEPFKNFNGTRAIRTSILYSHLSHLRTTGYGAEAFFNDLIPVEKIQRIQLPFVFALAKWATKPTHQIMESFIKEYRDIIYEKIRQNFYY